MRAKEIDSISFAELAVRIGATLHALGLSEADCTLSLPDAGEVPSQTGRLLYDCYACVTEAALLAAPCDLTIVVNTSDGRVEFIAFYESESDHAPDEAALCLDDELRGRIAAAGGSVRSFIEEDTLHLIVTLPTGDADD